VTLLALVYVIAGFVIGSDLFWLAGGAVVGGLLVVGMVIIKRGSIDLLRWARQTVSLLIVVAIGVGIPLTAVWYATSLSEFPAGLTRAHELLFDAASRRLAVARALQLAFISIASLLPGLMYYLFDRARLGALREQFVHHIFRLDRTLLTEGDLAAKYGSQIDETYGAADPSSDGARFAGGRRSPVIVATLLITIGWTFILLNQSVGALIEGALDVEPYELMDLLAPQRSAVAFGFLGGYFYALRVIRRGYVRGDLKPKTYTNLTVRLILVVILAWVLQIVISEPGWLIYPAAFLAGIVPDTWLSALADQVNRLLKWQLPNQDDKLSEELDLTKLEGIDLYDRSRLEDEGVNNIEALAHADLVNLMLRTRIPVPQLVDWVDQAILYLHSYHPPADGESRRLLDALREAGIRTASDLEAAKEAADKRDRTAFYDRFEVGGSSNPPTVEILLDTFKAEEWLKEIKTWHSREAEKSVDLRGATLVGEKLVLNAEMTDCSAANEAAHQIQGTEPDSPDNGDESDSQ